MFFTFPAMPRPVAMRQGGTRDGLRGAEIRQAGREGPKGRRPEVTEAPAQLTLILCPGGGGRCPR